MLVYDGDCGFCRRCVDFGREHLPFMPETRPWQELDLAEHGLTLDEVTRSVQLLGPHGLRAEGARAVAVLLALQPRAVLRAAGMVMLAPPVSWTAEGVYRLIARYRHRLPGGTTACAIGETR
ncbi:thiol-disulfide oxidoreductase DCC family protein [Sphaerisporangium rhizosphaerae]|uniref:Thiol-disulfide oxidoreductase DCC family protein n=1 Tax=Sphaerisporangium rhizosphaerae TaxID=2269375 RepID=A0ABW2PAX1_9ACTN